MNIDKSCENLSGGELRKINLWMALHKKSDVLILDEPTIELDKSSKEELFEYLKNRIQNKLLIVLTHDKELMGISTVARLSSSGGEITATPYRPKHAASRTSDTNSVTTYDPEKSSG